MYCPTYHCILYLIFTPMKYRSLLFSLLLILLVVNKTNCIHFCFQRNIDIASSHSLSVEEAENNHDIQAETIKQSQTDLRSYHPHYLMSLSYPHPITSHIYYGQVSADRPLFLYADIDKWHPNSIEKFTINGVQFTDASAQYFLLRRQQIFRYMLVLQVENSYEKEIPYRMEVNQMSNHFFIVCSFESKSESFAIYLTENGKVLELDSHPGIKINVRNQTGPSPRENWKFSRQVRWKGQDNRQQGTSFRGFVLEIEYSDRKLLETVKLNLRQIKDPSDQTSTFLTRESSVFNKNHPEIILVKQKYESCSATATQKILDGLSYEYGRLQIRDGSTVIDNEPKELLSFCPSGKRFPWGFLWDDGFHCEVAVRKDHNLVLKVIKSWLNTMLDNGWIPREQNRGAERQDLCNCPRFMPKDIRDGNPPTLLLALDYLNKQKMLTSENFQGEYWQKIKKLYNWFMSTQKDTQSLIFKWHDSLNQQGASFTSGMDDFPRPVISKGQIDLQTWMYFFTKFLAQTAHLYGQPNNEYISNLEIIKSNFKFYISPQDSTYRDIASDGTFSPQFGYPNILPIAFGIPNYNSKEYNATIRKIKLQLDIGNGLASISKLSHFYLQNRDAYWKGPVWININYLFLRGLKLFYKQEKQLYQKLRNDVLRMVCDNWRQSGYFYENYIQGKGSFGYPFNGWTSLVAIIEEENY